MEIAIIASDMKKELMTQFCIAYCGVLSKHNLCATSITAKYISEATGLKIEKLLAGEQGGEQQITSRVAYNEIDLLLYFRDTRPGRGTGEIENELMRMCDQNNVPVATNIATAEVLIMALDRGDLDWREIVNPRSALNRKTYLLQDIRHVLWARYIHREHRLVERCVVRQKGTTYIAKPHTKRVKRSGGTVWMFVICTPIQPCCIGVIFYKQFQSHKGENTP